MQDTDQECFRSDLILDDMIVHNTFYIIQQP